MFMMMGHALMNTHELEENYNMTDRPKMLLEDYLKAVSDFTILDSPSFLMIDIDLKDFASKDKLDRVMNRILKKIKTSMRGHPTMLWTGNGYHIYQP